MTIIENSIVTTTTMLKSNSSEINTELCALNDYSHIPLQVQCEEYFQTLIR
jgi:hypothetical protein